MGGRGKKITDWTLRTGFLVGWNARWRCLITLGEKDYGRNLSFQIELETVTPREVRSEIR